MNKKKQIPHYEFLQTFNRQKPQPVYCIIGSEVYLIDQVLAAIEKRFSTPGSKEFDSILFYGDTDSGAQILEQLEMLPFLAKFKLVVVKYFDKLKTSDKNVIADYIKNPTPTSILVLISEKTDARTNAGKSIAEHAVNITCRSPYSPDDIVRWLRHKIGSESISMDNEAVMLFAGSIPLDFMTAANELEKLTIFTRNSGRITADDVKETIGHTKTDKVFDLQNAIGERNLKKSLQILENMLSHEDPNKIIVFIITMLTRFFTQIWKVDALRLTSISDSEIESRYLPEVFYRYRRDYLGYAKNYNIAQLRKVFSLLLQADTDAKSLNVKEEIILHKLVYELIKVA